MKLDPVMDLPNEHIFDVFFPQTLAFFGEPVEVQNQNVNETQDRGLVPDRNAIQHMAFGRPQMRIDQRLLGAGDGPHNNINNMHNNNNNNLPPLIILQRPERSSKFWRFLPLLIIMSSFALKCLLNSIGIDTQTASLLGMSFNVHFSCLQWLVLLASYWLNSFDNRSISSEEPEELKENSTPEG